MMMVDGDGGTVMVMVVDMVMVMVNHMVNYLLAFTMWLCYNVL
jgi:hypothetical protein